MTYFELKTGIQQNIFTFLDILKLFPDEKETTVKIQLHRLGKKKLVTLVKRGLYCFDPQKIDELALAGLLYQPSYVSLETALNYYGIIPDVSLSVNSISATTTKRIKNGFGSFSYHKIKKDLFFGFKAMESPDKITFNIAFKEKALLDYIYIRRISDTHDLRLNLKSLDKKIYTKFSKSYPVFVQKVKLSKNYE